MDENSPTEGKEMINHLRGEMIRETYPIEPGVTHPLGAVPDEHGVNF